MGPQDLLDRLELARLVTKSFGKLELDQDVWTLACSLDQERKERVKTLLPARTTEQDQPAR